MLTREQRNQAEELFRRGSLNGGFHESTFERFLAGMGFTEEETAEAMVTFNLRTGDGTHWVLPEFLED